jgi:hypothetical protein
MDADEFALWAAFYRANPWGEARADLRAAIIASTVANYAGKTRKPEAGLAAPADFIPDFGAAREPEPEPDPLAFFKALKG